MSNVTVKNLILSQPKSGLNGDVKPRPVLIHEILPSETSTVLKVEIPGVDPSTVEVNCENNILSVVCEKGDFVHPIDSNVDTSRIKAEIQWGLLTLTIPAPAAPVAHSIKINIHDAVKSSPNKSSTKFTSEE